MTARSKASTTSRAPLLIHREEDLDAFDQAFSAHFRGIELASVKIIDELEEWLKDPKMRRELSEDEIAALKALDIDELRKLFEAAPARTEGTPRRRQPLDRHGRHLSVRQRRHEPRRHSRRWQRRRSQRHRRRRCAALQTVPLGLGARRPPNRSRPPQAQGSVARRPGARARHRQDDRRNREARRGARDRPAPAAPPERARAPDDGRRRLDGPARAPGLASLLRREARLEHSRAQDVLLPQLHLRPPLRDRALQRSHSRARPCSIATGPEYKLGPGRRRLDAPRRAPRLRRLGLLPRAATANRRPASSG